MKFIELTYAVIPFGKELIWGDLSVEERTAQEEYYTVSIVTSQIESIAEQCSGYTVIYLKSREYFKTTTHYKEVMAMINNTLHE